MTFPPKKSGVFQLNMILNAKFKVLTPHELLNSIPNVRGKWSVKTPMEKWCYLYSIGKAACDLVCIPAFQENVKNIHWFGYFFLVYMTSTVVLTAYTVFYYIYRGEFQMCLPSTCLLAILIGVSIFRSVV